MIRSASFWRDEIEATLLLQDHGYFSSVFNSPQTDAAIKDGDKIKEITDKWLASLGVKDEDIAQGKALKDVEQPDRIFVLDAERTFRSDKRRKALVNLLDSLSKRHGDYHQGLSYITSFLLLTLDEPTVRAVITKLHDEPKYMPNYWCTEAVKFATDAHVFAAMLKERDRELSDHFAKNTLMPDTYCQKWFVALCVHVLPFSTLMNFLSHFFEEGHVVFFKFGLSLAAHLRTRLLASNNPGELFSLLRLDQSNFGTKDQTKEAKVQVFIEAADAIVAGARNVSLEGFNIEEMRKVAFETIVGPRVENARKRMAQREEEDSDSEIVFSDESDDDDEKEVTEKMKAAKI